MLTLPIVLIAAVALSCISYVRANGENSSLEGTVTATGSNFFLFSDSVIENQYNKVNIYLVNNLPEDDPEKNLAKAIEWLELKPSNRFWPNAHLGALDLLKGLKNLEKDTECSHQALEVIKKNVQATHFRTYKHPSRLIAPRRIDKLVNHYLFKHANYCRDIYPSKFITKHQQLRGNEHIGFVETFELGHLYGELKRLQNESSSNDWTYSTVEDLKEHLMEGDYKLNIRLLMTSYAFNASKLYDAINYLAIDDPEVKFLNPVIDEINGGFIIEKEKIKALLKKYYKEPCKYYMKEFGPEIFEPALYEALLIDDNKYKDADRILSSFDYYIGQLSFRSCGHLGYRKGILYNNLKLLATIAKPFIKKGA